MIFLTILSSFMKCEMLTQQRESTERTMSKCNRVEEDENGYLVPRNFLLDQSEKTNVVDGDNDTINEHSQLQTEEEHIYEEVGSFDVKKECETNEFRGNGREDITRSEGGRYYPHVGRLIYNGANVSTVFSEFVKQIKNKREELDFQCLDSVRITDYQFENHFFIQYRPNFMSNRLFKSHLFFIGFKRLLIEIFLFVEDQNARLRLKFNNKTKEIFDGYRATLIHSYHIFFEKNNLSQIIQRNFRPSTNHLDELWALELLRNVLFPKKLIGRSEESIKWLVSEISKNSKKYNNPNKAFSSLDFIAVKVRGITRIYPAKYYLIGSIFHSLIN